MGYDGALRKAAYKFWGCDMAEIEFVGVDGCKCGWFSVGFSGDGEFESKVFHTFDELVEYYKSAKLILVDIPIGLPEGGEGRLCDKEAKAKLPSGLKPSVFPTPARATARIAWQFPKDYDKANATQKKVAGKGLSKQTFGIAPKIGEVDVLMESRGDGATPQIREIHPEICFWALNGQQSIPYSKKTADGIAQRLDVLQQVEPKAQAIFDAGCSHPCKGVAEDDVLDALAAAVTARRRGQSLELQTLPKNPDNDSKGLAMEMVYWVP